MLTSRRKVVFLAAAGLLGLAACYGDEEAPPDVCAHACANAPINLPEGGEVRLELVAIDDGPVEVRTHAWFATDQSPEARRWPRPPADWSIQDGPTLCGDLRDGQTFPAGSPDARSYVDVGDSVTFSSEGRSIRLDKAMNVQDWAADTYHDILYVADVPAPEVVPGAEYEVSVAGSDQYPARTFDLPVRVPEDYDVTFPDMTNQVPLSLNEDLVFQWSSSSDDPYDFAFVLVADFIGPIYFCIGPQTGHMTIPKEVVASLPPSGQLLHGVQNHRVEVVDDRRVDLIGVNCVNGDYFIDPSL